MSWAKFDDGYDDNPKCRAAGKDGRALDSVGIRHCARNLTDGLIADYDLPVLAAKADVNAKRTVAKLIEVDRWHGPGHDCDRCPECPPGHHVVHDYLDYNPSAEKDQAKRQARAEAGRKGGRKSRPPATNSDGNSEAIASSVASSELEQTGSKNGTPYPVTPSSLTLTETSPGSVGESSEPAGDTQPAARRKRSGRRPEVDHHPDSRRLCQLLMDSLGRRGYKTKPVSDAWLTEMDRLIRIDRRDPQRVEGFIRWLEDGQHKVAQFWRSNIRSPHKMREEWDRIREQRDDADARVRQNGQRSQASGSVNRAWETTQRLLEQPGYEPPGVDMPDFDVPALRVVGE